MKIVQVGMLHLLEPMERLEHVVVVGVVVEYFSGQSRSTSLIGEQNHMRNVLFSTQISWKKDKMFEETKEFHLIAWSLQRHIRYILLYSGKGILPLIA